MTEKDIFYFPHDANARRDPKIIALIKKRKMQGYGMFWVLLEILRQQKDYRLDISQEFIYDSIAEELKTTITKAKEFIQECITEFKLFDADDQYLWCPSQIKRMQPLENKRIQRSKAGKLGAEARWGSNTVLDKESGEYLSNSIAMAVNDKVNENEINEIIEKSINKRKEITT